MPAATYRANHAQNATTWFTLATTLFTIFVVIGGGIVVLIAGALSMALGGVSVHQHRKAKKSRSPHRPFHPVKEAKKATRAAARRQGARAKTAGSNLVHGKQQGGRAEWNPKTAKQQAQKPGTRGNKPGKVRQSRACTARCRNSVQPVDTCECSCGGRNHGKKAAA